jgi:5'-deoxynucleotidase YfbR-like HD superfamily hydrolase
MMNEQEFLRKWMKSPLSQMALVYRYSSFPIHHRESVAEHTFFVQFLSWILAQHIVETDNSVKINFRTLLEKGLFHDLDESITGDVIRSFKHSNELLHKTMLAVSTAVVQMNYGDMPGGGSYIRREWQSSKDNTLEGCLIDFADVWSVWLYQYRETLMGSVSARNHLHLVATRIDEAKWHPRILPYARGMSNLIRGGNEI